MFLAGPFNLEKQPEIQNWFANENALLFGNGGALAYTLSTETYQDILNRIPQGVSIDYLLYFFLENNCIPAGIENSPFPTIAVISDWSINLEAIARVAPFFSYLLVDYPGVLSLKKLGFEQVNEVSLFAFNPGGASLNEIPKAYDVSMIGNLNDVVYEERARYLKRLTLLGDKYNVKIFAGVFGADCVQVIRSSKITFNHTIRGEMNVRCFEALAYGSLLFIEDANIECKRYLEDKVHCVYYNEDNFENLIEHYLNCDKEREAIVQNGFQFIQTIKDTPMQRLVKKVGEIGKDIRARQPEAASWSVDKKAISRVFHAFNSTERSTRFTYIRDAFPLFNKAEASYYFAGGLWFLELSDLAEASIRVQHLEQCVQWFRKTLDLDPHFVTAYLNLGQAYLKLGRGDEARASFETGLSQVEQGAQCDVLATLVHPVYQNEWRMEKDKRFALGEKDFSKLFLAKLWEGLGDALVTLLKLDRARESYEKALSYEVWEWALYRKVGDTLVQMNQPQKAIEAYERTLRIRPFYVEVWEVLLRLYRLTDEKNKEEQLREEIRRIIKCFPSFEPLRTRFVTSTNS